MIARCGVAFIIEKTEFRNQLYKVFKYGCFGAVGVGILLLASLPIIFKMAFGPIVETVTIKQKIGGELICRSTYMADFQSWDYLVDYKYKSENMDTIEIGRGEYYGRNWDQNDQIIRMGNWMVLSTGNKYGADKLLIGKIDESNWQTFEITPSSVKADSFWLSKNIIIKDDWQPEESFVTQIRGGDIEVEYLYRVGDMMEEQEKRLITYRINEGTGVPEMVKIQLVIE